MNYQVLIDGVKAVIKQNGNEEITGDLLQQTLLAMISALGVGYQFVGVATPDTVPGTPDARVCYLCVGAGNYANFGTQFVLDGTNIAICRFDTVWTNVLIDIPTKSSVVLINDLASETGDSEVLAMSQKAITDALNTKVDKVTGKGLSTNDFTNKLKAIVEAALTTDNIASELGESDTKVLSQAAITSILSGYAKTSGLYQQMIVGSAQGMLATSAVEAFFLFQQSGATGNGAALIPTIKGKTIAWNQLVDEDTTEVTIPSGHKYFAIIGGTASVATSDGTAIAVTGGVDIVTDLTLLGLGDLTADQFRALYPALYYAANAGVLKSNDAAALLTDGRNQWDEQWELGSINYGNGQEEAATDRLRSSYIPVFGGKEYYFFCGSTSQGGLRFYDENKNYIGFTSKDGKTTGANISLVMPDNCAYFRFLAREAPYKNDICINLSDASFNGTYQPYWKREIQFRIKELTGVPAGGTEADRVLVAPNGAAGAGSAEDLFFVENGETKFKKVMLEEVDLGDLNWSLSATVPNVFVSDGIPDKIVQAEGASQNLICSRYVAESVVTLASQLQDKRTTGNASGNKIVVKDSAYTDAATFKAAMSGVKLIAEASTPIVYTDLQYADGTPFIMPQMFRTAQGGTMLIVSPEGATAPSAPFSADIIYPVDPIASSGASLKNLLEALKTATVITSYTMTFNSTTQQYEFTITK